MIGTALTVKWPKLMALGGAVKYPVLILCGSQLVIPILYYLLARRSVYLLTIHNEHAEDEYYEIKHLSPTMWTTKTTKFTAEDVAWPDNPEAMTSFIVNKRKF